MVESLSGGGEAESAKKIDPTFVLTPNVLAQIAGKVAGYDILLSNHNYKVQEMYTVQDHPPSPNEFLLLPPLESLYKTNVRNQELPQPGDSRPGYVTVSKRNF